MFKRLKYKFAFINLFLCSLLIISTFSILLFTSSKQMENTSYNALRNSLRDSSRDFELDPGFNKDKNPPAPPTAINKQSNVTVVIANKDGLIIDYHNPIKDIEIDEQLLQEYTTTVINSKETQGELKGNTIRYMVEINNGQYAIAFTDYSVEKELLTKQAINYLLVGIASLFVLFILSLFLSSMAIKPIIESTKRQKQFSENVSHELKTPLTVILSNSTLLKTSGKLTSKQSEYLGYIENESKRMKKLVLDMLYLSKFENQTTSTFEDINLSQLVLSSTLLFEPLFYENKRSLSEEIEEDIYIRGVDSEIRQILNILLDNACKYSKINSKTNLILTKEKKFATIKISNNTRTLIDETELTRIFDRFYKIDKARTRNDSYGLGLAIAKELVSNHDGSIKVGIENERIIFTIRIPLR